jgi:peptidoglycan/xylan/chitin deacetylase (PgdA/CDA1 family)
MLGTMSNEDEILNELTASANRIKEELGYFPVSISYPVGSYNHTTVALSKKAGYTMGLAVKQTTFDPQLDDIFEIPRIELYNESWFKTKVRILNVLEKFKTLIRYK